MTKKTQEKITRVIDWNLLETTSGKVVQLANINVQKMGDLDRIEATNILKKHIEDKIVCIEPMPYNNHGKMVANVTIIGGDSVNVNDIMRDALHQMNLIDINELSAEQFDKLSPPE